MGSETFRHINKRAYVVFHCCFIVFKPTIHITPHVKPERTLSKEGKSSLNISKTV